MIRLWTWEALAHGAEVVSYFRWRQAQSAQEQMHAGLNRPGQHEWSPGGLEALQCGEEIALLGQLPDAQQAPVAIVYDYDYDYEAHWITHIQPQGKDFRYHELVFRWYEAIRRGGLDVDFVKPGAELDGYKVVLVPSMPHVNEMAESTFKKYSGVILFGPRTGSKTRNFSIPQNLPPGPLAELLDIKVVEVSSMRPSLRIKVSGEMNGYAEKWIEHVETGATVLAEFETGHAAMIANGHRHYIACWPDETLLFSTMRHVCATAGLKRIELPPHVRFRQRGNITFAFNYGPEGFDLDARPEFLLGSADLLPQEIAAWRNINS
jgi:beta-galactosidase